MKSNDDYVAINRALWDARTAYHVASDFYDLAGFRAGQSSLNDIERALLGDVQGCALLHLQCHFGQDTLSLGRLGARAVGVDLSEQAIGQAQALAAELGLAVEFIACNVYDLPEHLPERQFDVVFTSYGVLGWLPDLGAWARLVAQYLRPGGRLVLVEFHPVVWMFDNDFTRIEYSYFNRGVIQETELGTYADEQAPLQRQSMTWNHNLGEVLGSLLDAGLHLAHFAEYDYSPYNCFAHTEETAPGKYRIRALGDKIPMVYSVVASKPA